MGARIPESLEGRTGEEGGVDRSSPPAGLRLRPMEKRDVERVAEIESASFSNPWKKATFRELLPREDAELWVAEIEDVGVVGYLVLWYAADEAELADIAVSEDHRDRGIGSLLLERAVDRAFDEGVRSLFLEVRASNERAAALYEARGFRVVTVRKDYYKKPKEDALVMLRSLW